MNWVKTTPREIYRMFVDDDLFAAAILAWLLVVSLVASRLGLASGWSATALFTGLAVIFIESATRRARH